MGKYISVVYLFVCLFVIFSCENSKNEIMALPVSNNAPSQTGDSVTLLYTDSAKLKVMLRANQMLVYDKNVSEPMTILPKGFYITIFDQSEKTSATLKARYGVRYTNSHLMLAKYAVEVVNVRNEKLETEKLIWNENKKQIYTDDYIKITTPTQIINGKGLVSNEDFTKYEIREVTGTFNINNHEK
ncbi:MAG: LPS export ABC transporter periplasmic protein LptC [Bacteroidetes bacterium]|nr:LPS export ABC transporter periplasmic protein LptC [Bacteroidota bacterium]